MQQIGATHCNSCISIITVVECWKNLNYQLQQNYNYCNRKLSVATVMITVVKVVD
jgi:hypothetical protein